MADESRKGEGNDAVAVMPPIVDATKSPPPPPGRWEEAALPVSMVMVQIFTMVMLLLSKLAFNTGMRPFVLIVYRNLIGAAVVAPLALIFERKMWKEVNLSVWGWIFLNATCGIVLAMGLYYYGLRATNAAYSVNFLNLIPIVTFIIAIALREEKPALGKWPGRMKLLGAVLCVGGTMAVSLLKGRLLHLWPSHLLKVSHAQPTQANAHHNMVAGTLILCASCFSYALWFTVQARLYKKFQSMYWVTTLTCLVGSLQSFVIGLILAPDKADWKLKWDLQLLTVVYSGVFNTGITLVLISWAISRRGPMYPPMFNSLSLIITTVMDSVLLGTNIYLGSVFGTLLIIVGLYAFLWGKNKELKQDAAKKKAEKQTGEAQQGRQGGVEMV